MAFFSYAKEYNRIKGEISGQYISLERLVDFQRAAAAAAQISFFLSCQTLLLLAFPFHRQQQHQGTLDCHGKRRVSPFLIEAISCL
jgi:hypothetical protein